MKRILIAASMLLLMAAVAEGQTVRCESDGGYRECRVESGMRVTLERQISRLECVEGTSWGSRDGLVWVNKGCRADFKVSRRLVSSLRGELVVCESDGSRRICRADTRGGVVLQRQISRSACIEDRTWGYDQSGVWVDEGCRAEFMIGGRGTLARRDERVVCESEDGRRKTCRVDTGDGVDLARQISRTACKEGEDWGYDRRGIWVDHGCRAEFVVRSDGRSNDRMGRGGRDSLSQTVVCESADGERTFCRADTRFGVELSRQISRTACERGKTWGFDEKGIWVDDGCRAEFVVGRRR